MPARSAVSLLAAPAPLPFPLPLSLPLPLRPQCLSFLYPPPALFRPLTHSSFSRSARAQQRRHHGPRRASTHRLFHHTTARRDDAIDNARNHYETLKVAPTASASDIKKSFYNLSKTHHPDLHEASARRLAAKRFMRISEAYSILSSPPKRAKYDREHMDLPTPSSSSSTSSYPPKKGSYASTGPAGGRPASGLSRRRGTFQGPPPSFFRSGGWGAQGEKRRAAHEESTGMGAGSSAGAEAGRGSMGGMGPGQDPFGHREDVPHFDKESHQRTGRHNDRRREARRAAAADGHGQRVTIEPERGVTGMFFVIGGILFLSGAAPLFLSFLGSASTPQPKERGAAKGKG